jgi:hypothetical protein
MNSVPCVHQPEQGTGLLAAVVDALMEAIRGTSQRDGRQLEHLVGAVPGTPKSHACSETFCESPCASTRSHWTPSRRRPLASASMLI